MTKKPQQLFGWLGPDYNFVRAWEESPARAFRSFVTKDYRKSEGERVAFWDFAKQVTGDYLPNTPQEIGDCVSWGLKHAVDHLACFEIVRLGQREEFRPSFAPYFYGVSRIQIGGGELGGGDGSLGIWGAEGVKKYGVLRADHEGVPAYAGAVAKKWGARPGPPKEFLEVGRNHLVKEFARISSYEELRDALVNGYPCTIASMRGFNMQLAFDQKTNRHWWTGRDQWPHQMNIIGIDDDPRRPGIYRGNSWGPTAHGPQQDGPAGGGWQDAEDIDRELRDRNTECICYSQFDGFPAQSAPDYSFC